MPLLVLPSQPLFYQRACTKIQPLLDENGSNPSRITVYNLWRRFDEDGMDAPFALCDSRTVSEKELIPTDLFNYGKEEEKTEEEEEGGERDRGKTFD